MKSTIHLGAQDFMKSFVRKAMRASASLYVQAMTFEGDVAGEQLINVMIASPARDKRLIIDSFSKVVVSDHFIFSTEYLKNASFREEIAKGKKLITSAQSAGIQVLYTNPTGYLMQKYPLRNHKKMVIIDEKVSYLGGLNFSDHNFEWQDMMIEIKDIALASCLSNDFLITWKGENQSSCIDLKKSTLYFFSGIKSQELYERFFDQIRNASKSVKIISPYISEPLFSVLKQAAKRGIKVTIISPEANNKSLFKQYVQSESAKGYFQLLYHPGMSHLKAIVIDDRQLVFGSSNYDLISYYFEQEVVLLTREKSLVQSFLKNVLEPIMDKSFSGELSTKSSMVAPLVMKSLALFCKYSSKTILKPY